MSSSKKLETSFFGEPEDDLQNEALKRNEKLAQDYTFSKDFGSQIDKTFEKTRETESWEVAYWRMFDISCSLIDEIKLLKENK